MDRLQVLQTCVVESKKILVENCFVRVCEIASIRSREGIQSQARKFCIPGKPQSLRNKYSIAV